MEVVPTNADLKIFRPKVSFTLRHTVQPPVIGPVFQESGKNALESRIADLNNKHREVETSWADRMTSSITEWESKLEERDNELTGLHSTKSELEMKASQLMQRVESLQVNG